MPLDRHQQVARVWDWLPAFRAVAEYGNLQRAGLALSVSPSALSRSINLLEDTLGLRLFTRGRGGMVLTGSGERLLVATRDAMRLVHSSLADAAPQRLRAGAVGPALPRLLCEAVAEAFPDWDLAFHEVTSGDAAEQLRCGDLDLVLAHEPLPGTGLEAYSLPALRLTIAAAPGRAVDRFASLSAAGMEWPAATVRAASLDQLITIAQTLGIGMFCPLYSVPAGWEVLSQPSSRPVLLLSRAYSGGPPVFVEKLLVVLRARLAAKASAQSPREPQRSGLSV